MHAIAIYSGGLDSFTMLNDMLRIYDSIDVLAMTFDYGQRHDKEIAVAKRFCMSQGVGHKRVELPFLKQIARHNALTGMLPVPHGHYEDQSMRKTVVPNRNMIFLSVAIAQAIELDCSEVWIGVHAGDHVIYPDCRPDFMDAMRRVAHIASYKPVNIFTPYLHMGKAAIIRKGLEFALDYSKTWTCYEGADNPCGQCGACTERAEAFAANGIEDPLVHS